MPFEDTFPPVDSISPLVGPEIVVPRRRRFGRRSREQYNELLQSQKELRESESTSQTHSSDTTEPPLLENPPHFDKLV